VSAAWLLAIMLLAANNFFGNDGLPPRIPMAMVLTLAFGYLPALVQKPGADAARVGAASSRGAAGGSQQIIIPQPTKGEPTCSIMRIRQLSDFYTEEFKRTGSRRGGCNGRYQKSNASRFSCERECVSGDNSVALYVPFLE
jgi:hypothetical protein